VPTADAAGSLAALNVREETRPMPNIDAHTRHLLVQNAELSSLRIANSRKSRVDAIADMCAKVDIVWAVVAEAALRTNWIALPCADAAEASELDRQLS
jgi:hypothetical protein